MSIQAGYDAALGSTPTLVSSPDLASAAAQSSDPSQTAQVLSQSQDAASTTAALQHHAAHHGSLLGSLFNKIGGGFSSVAQHIGSGLNYLSKPLGDVQHDYRYLHDLWTKSDPVSATLATLGVVGGGVGGFFVGGPIGARLGAEGAASLESHLAGAGVFGQADKNLYKQSQNEKVSFGRDVANLLGARGHTDSGVGKFVSGLADTAFDFNADPLLAAGKLAAARRSATGLTDTYAARNVPAIRSFMLAHGFGGLGMQDTAGVNALDRIAAARESNPQYNRALDAIATSHLEGGAGAIVSQHPEIARMAPMLSKAIDDLGAGASKADAAQAVHETFLASAQSAEMLGNGYGMLPSRTLLRAKIGSPVANALKNVGSDTTKAQQGSLRSALNPASETTLAGAVRQKVRTFSGYLPFTISRDVEDGRQLLDLSNTRFPPSDPGALKGIYSSMTFSLGEKAAQQVVSDFAKAQAAGDLDQMKLIYANGYKKMLIAAGVPDDSNLVKNLSDHIDGATDDLKARHYGYGYERGTEVNSVAHDVPARLSDETDAPTQVTTDLGLWDHQTGQFSYPNFWQIKNAVRAMDRVSNVLGGVDQAVADHYTNSIFKPLSLVNAGFGLRVAAAEALPAAFRYGALNMIQNRVASSVGKHNYDMDESQRLLDRANAARESGDMEGFTELTKQAQDAQVGHFTAAVAHLISGDRSLGGTIKNVAAINRGIDQGLRYRATSGMAKLLHISDADLDLATNLVARGKGDAVWGVGKAGHQQHRLPTNAADRANTGLWLTANNKVGVRATGNYTLFNPSNEHYTDMWHGQLSRVAYDESAQNIAQDLITANKRIRPGTPGEPDIPGTPAKPAVPPDVASPAAPGLPPLFHGTSRAFADDKVGEKYTNGVSADNLLGPGFYTTDKAEIAAKYTSKGRKALGEGAEPTIYSVHHAGTPRMLDMDQPLPAPVLADFKNFAAEDGSGLSDFISPEEFDGLTGVQAYTKLRSALSEYSVENQIPKHEIDEMLHDLNDSIAGHGYDGMTHVGGVYASKSGVQHNVHIFFDNDKLGIQRHNIGSPEVPGTPSVPGKPGAPGFTADDAARYAITREANRISGLTPTGGVTQVPAYQKGRDLLARYKSQDPTEFAADRVDSLRNLLTGNDGTFHADLARKVAKGEAPSFEDIAAKPLDQAPKQVPGLELAQAGPVNWMNEAVNKGFTRLVDPIINHLSREPMFFAGVKEQMPALQSMVDRGIIDQEDAYQQAIYRATEGMLPQIHNVQLRSQFAAMARNIMPFYFAQEQAMRRTAYLVGKNPAAFREYLQVHSALMDPNFVHTDANGNRSLMIPYSSALGPGILNTAAALGLPLQSGLPLSFTGSMNSLQTVLPELKPPGTSPLLSIPLNEVAKFFPEWNPPIKAVLGDQGFGRSLRSEAIPNSFMRNALMALSPDEQDKGFANAFVSAMSAAAAHGEIPDANANEAVKQAFIDRVKNNARSTFFLKAILSVFSPLSPQAVPEDFGLRDEFYKLVADKKMTYPEAVNKFIKEHGNSAVSYTIAKSDNTSGALIPTTQAALDFINNNHDLIREHQSAAYFVPESASAKADERVLHNELVNMGLRETTTPKDFINQMYIKSGNQTYREDKKAHDDALGKLTSPDDIKAENQAWAAHVEGLKKANVIWAGDFTSEARNLRAINLYADMQKLYAEGKVPDSPQAAGISSLMDDFKTHLAQLAQLPADRSGGADRQAEKDAWKSYLDEQAQAHPELTNVIDNVFKRLDARI